MALQTSFIVLASQFNDENYLRMNSGEDQVCLNPKAWGRVIANIPGTNMVLRIKNQALKRVYYILYSSSNHCARR